MKREEAKNRQENRKTRIKKAIGLIIGHRNLKLGEIAKELGVVLASVSDWKRGESVPSGAMLLKFIETYGEISLFSPVFKKKRNVDEQYLEVCNFLSRDPLDAKIRSIMAFYGVSSAKLAEELGVGLSTVNGWIYKKKSISGDSLLGVIEAFGCYEVFLPKQALEEVTSGSAQEKEDKSLVVLNEIVEGAERIRIECEEESVKLKAKESKGGQKKQKRKRKSRGKSKGSGSESEEQEAANF